MRFFLKQTIWAFQNTQLATLQGQHHTVVGTTRTAHLPTL